MQKVRFNPTFLAVAILAVAVVPTLHAQATRTWVSGVGDDVNPCSRTAPCKTLAGAISKTAAGGEIDALDPGGFGAVTITKSITIDGGSGSGWASVLASGVNGIVISGAGIDVTLRNLSINGAGTTPGLVGVKILQANSVHIQNCNVFGFATNPGRGISDERQTGGKLYVRNTAVTNNSGTGIAIAPGGGSTTIITAEVDHAELTGNANGLVGVTSHCTISNSVISGNSLFGIDAEGSSTLLAAESCAISSNGTGINIGSGTATIRVSNCHITDNSTGISTGTGSIFSYGNNKIAGNSVGNGPFTATIAQQ